MACSESRSGGFRPPSGFMAPLWPAVLIGTWRMYMLAHANDTKPAAWVPPVDPALVQWPAPIATDPNAPRWQPVCTVNGRAIDCPTDAVGIILSRQS